MEYVNGNALVSTEWLADHLDDPMVRICDATWYMPNVDRSARDEYAASHIPGAVYWDIDEIADPANPLPHMVPDATSFAHHMARLGIADGMRVVFYDSTGMGNAPRGWWTMRYFSHDNVAVLNGGMKKWLAEGRPTSADAPSENQGQFTARVRPERIREIEQIRVNIDSGADQVVDVRAAGRYAGTAPEPREGMRSGHIPNSLNLPFNQLIDSETATMLPADALAAQFETAGVDMARPVATSCGSGVTACVVALGLHLLGHENVAVYDGSWTEWGGRDDTPIES